MFPECPPNDQQIGIVCIRWVPNINFKVIANISLTMETQEEERSPYLKSSDPVYNVE